MNRASDNYMTVTIGPTFISQESQKEKRKKWTY